MTKKTSVKKFVVGEMVVPLAPMLKKAYAGEDLKCAPGRVFIVSMINKAGVHTFAKEYGLTYERDEVTVVFSPDEIERYAEAQPATEIPSKAATTPAPESDDRKDLIRTAVNKSKSEIFGAVGCIVAMIGSMILAVALVNSVPEESRPFIMVGVPLLVFLGLYVVFAYQAIKLGIVGSDD